MTVNSLNYISDAAGNGSSTVFVYNFKILKADHLTVDHTDVAGNEVTLVEGTDYSVANVGKSSGGSITFPLGTSAYSTLAVGETLVMYRNPPVTQLLDIRNQSAYHPENIEDALDQMTMILQRFTSAPLVDENDQTQFDLRSLRAANATDPVNSGDLTTMSWVQGQISSIADGVLGVVPNQWAGTTDGTASISITGTTLDEEKGYMVSLGGVMQQPTVDFTVDDTTDTLTWTSTPGSGIPYWIVAFGYARQVNEYPSHDHPEEFMPYNAGGTANAITLAVPTGRIAPTVYTDQMCGVFTPTTANTTTIVTANVHSIGAKSVVLNDGSTVPPVGFITGSKRYFWQYDQSLDKILILFPTLWAASEVPDNSITLAMMASGTAGHKLTYDASGDPQTEIDRKWVTLGNSGQITSGTSYAFEGIPDTATRIVITLNSLRGTGSGSMTLEVGYGGSPTYITASGDYDGDHVYTNSASTGIIPWDTDASIGYIYNAGNQSNFKVVFEKINDGAATWSITSNGNFSTASSYISNAGGRIKGSSLVSDLSAIKFNLPSGTFTDGYMTCKYYGNPDA